MIELRASVIIPTRDRPEKIEETLANLTRQSTPSSDFEVIIVDDGSFPPVTLPVVEVGTQVRLLRLSGEERSAARNAGASAARGELLVFVDDDISVREDFLTSLLEAHREWPAALLVGSIRLPEEASRTAFGRFRQRLEDQVVPMTRGLVPMRNFCAAANMAISRERFNELGGFDRDIASSEDQDLALRHTAFGGQIAFVPEARVIHRDNSLDLRSYCRRNEWGSRMMIPFCRRYPEFTDNVEREEANGPIRWGAEAFSRSAGKIVKSILAWSPLLDLLTYLVSRVDRLLEGGRWVDRAYRLVLGIYIFRGYRKGLRDEAEKKSIFTRRSAASPSVSERR